MSPRGFFNLDFVIAAQDSEALLRSSITLESDILMSQFGILKFPLQFLAFRDLPYRLIQVVLIDSVAVIFNGKETPTRILYQLKLETLR